MSHKRQRYSVHPRITDSRRLSRLVTFRLEISIRVVQSSQRHVDEMFVDGARGARKLGMPRKLAASLEWYACRVAIGRRREKSRITGYMRAGARSVKSERVYSSLADDTDYPLYLAAREPTRRAKYYDLRVGAHASEYLLLHVSIHWTTERREASNVASNGKPNFARFDEDIPVRVSFNRRVSFRERDSFRRQLIQDHSSIECKD